MTPSALPVDPAAPVADDATPIEAVQPVDAAVPEAIEPVGTDAATAPAEAPAGPPAAPAGPGPAVIAARLAERFPALFGQPPKPLKLRIQADIQQRAPGEFPRRVLSVVLQRHTTSTPYLKALAQATQRYDLDGAPAGEVSEEHRQAAAAEVTRRRELVAARRQAERDAHRAARRGGTERPGRAAPGGAPGAGEGSAPAGAGADRPPRLPRPPRSGPGDRPNRADAGERGPRGHRADRPAGPRPERGDRPRQGPPTAAGEGQRRDRPPHADRADLAPRAPGAPRPDRPRTDRPNDRPRDRPNDRPHDRPGRADAARSGRPGPDAAQFDDPARRERAALLRAYESSTLTRANFCVLKRIGEAELEAQLAQARSERDAWQRERASAPPRSHPPGRRTE